MNRVHSVKNHARADKPNALARAIVEICTIFGCNPSDIADADNLSRNVVEARRMALWAGHRIIGLPISKAREELCVRSEYWGHKCIDLCRHNHRTNKLIRTAQGVRCFDNIHRRIVAAINRIERTVA